MMNILHRAVPNFQFVGRRPKYCGTQDSAQNQMFGRMEYYYGVSDFWHSKQRNTKKICILLCCVVSFVQFFCLFACLLIVYCHYRSTKQRSILVAVYRMVSYQTPKLWNRFDKVHDWSGLQIQAAVPRCTN